MIRQSHANNFRLLLVTPEYPPHNIGGGGKVVQTLARHIAQQAKVVVLSGRFRVSSLFEPVSRGADTNVDLYWLPLMPHADEKSPLGTYMPPSVRSTIFLARTVLKGRFDVIHLHGFGHLLVDLAAILCVLSKREYILTVHGFPVIPSQRKILGILYSIYARTIGKLTLKCASRVVGVSKSVAHEAIDYGTDIHKLRVIYNGIDLDEVTRFKKGLFRKKYGIAKSEYIILCVGRIIWQKGFQFIVQMLPSLIKEAQNIRLVLVGKDFGFAKELKQLAQNLQVDDKIIYTGFVDDLTYHQALIDADVLVIPSLVEPFGLVAVEGLAYGKPIVASHNCGLAEVLSNGSILRVDPQDTEQTKSAIVRVIKNRDLRRKLSLCAKKEFKKFGSTSMIDRYLHLYYEHAFTHVMSEV